MKKILALLFFVSINLYSQNTVIQYVTATSGTVTISDTQQNVQLIHDAGVTVSLSVSFPATPFNGQTVAISSASGVTTLTLLTTVGSIINGISTMAAGGNAKYQYITAQTKWYRIQ
jgi:hypothetical protein